MDVSFYATLESWGQGLGIRVPGDTVRDLRLTAGARVKVMLEVDGPANKPDNLPAWDFGGAHDVDEILNRDTR